MRILVTNDDGIFADGLRALADGLRRVAQVIVVAPDSERSAIGTAVTLRQPLRVQRVEPIVPEVETYSVEGTPGDSVILALGKLVPDGIDLVVSGINRGLNLGDDVLISGTVGAALQGYLRGIPALAISVSVNSQSLDDAARLAGLLAGKIDAKTLPTDIFLNVNLPKLPLAEIKGAKVTRLASRTHIDAVEDAYEGKQGYYQLVRRRINQDTNSSTDIGAIEQGNISITPLHTALLGRPSPAITDSLFPDLLQELRE